MKVKLLKKGIRLDGKYYPVWYSSSKGNINGNATITIKDYAILPEGLNKVFKIDNDTDIQSDYICLDRIRLSPDSPYFKQVEALAI